MNRLETDSLREMVALTGQVTVFTGAGISSESGIPTYRGNDGLWQKYDPAKYANITHFFKDPDYYWNFFREVRYPALAEAKPNRAHDILSDLEKRGVVGAIITQNIDGLHQLAGSVRVLELHGNTRRISCLDCGQRFTLDGVYEMLETRLPPVCTECGGVLKPEVVFFGESLPSDILTQAANETKNCGLFMVIGSSLVVQPAASLPVMAKENGARLVIINKDPTPLDRIADIVFHCGATEVLEQVVQLD